MSEFPEYNDFESSKQTGGKPQLIADFFEATVQRMLHDNVEYLLSSAWGNKSVEVLHLLSPPSDTEGRGRIGYHYLYESFDSDDQSRTHGMVIANPVIKIPDPIYPPPEQTRRQYSTHGPDSILRRDKVRRRTIFSLKIYGFVDTLDDPEAQEHDLVIRELKEDLLKINRAEPIRPASNQARRSLDLWDV